MPLQQNTALVEGMMMQSTLCEFELHMDILPLQSRAKSERKFAGP